MAKQTKARKAILLPISDDGDPFEVGDLVGFDSWEGMASPSGAPATVGSAFLGIIRAIVGLDATIEYLDVNMQPRGDMVTRPLASLREYILPTAPETVLPGSTDPDETKSGESDPPPAKAVDAEEPDVAIAPIRERNIAAKALSDDGWRVGGYLVLWGDENKTDLTGDWFTPNTDFKLDWYNRRPFLHEHSMDNEIKTTAVGFIDTLEKDEYGLWMEAQLDRANRYAKRVRELIQSGKAGLSSGSMSHVVRRRNNARSGEITVWPVGEGSDTVTPAEPRTLVVPIKHYVDAAILETAYKSIGQLADKWAPEVEEQEPPEKRQHSANGDNATDNGTTDPKPTDGIETKSTEKTEENMTISTEDMAAIADLVASRLTPAPVIAPTKALPAGGGALPVPPVEVKTDPAPKPVSISVIGDRRFMDYNSEDFSILTDIYRSVLDAAAMKRAMRPSGYELKPLESAAKAFFDEFVNDQDHKLQRMICAKAYRDASQNRIDSRILDYLPYRNMAAVEANDYNEEAVKAARLEYQAVLREDRKGSSFKSNELDNTGQSSFGAEWVPTIWNSEAWRRIRINNVFAGVLMAVSMPSSPWNWPIESGDPTVYFVAEGTDAAQLVLGSGNTLALSKAGTGKITFTAKKLGAHIGFSVEENEDSIIPIIPIWKYQTDRALRNYVDNTIANGDTATGASVNVNLIDGTPTTGTSYLAMDGMRKYGLVTNTAQQVNFNSLAPTLSQFRAMQTLLLPEYQADIQNLVYVVNVQTYQKMKALPEFNSYLNAGVPPTSQTGLLPGGSYDQTTVASNAAPMPVGYIDGIPVFVSAQIPLSQSTGKISATPANNIYGSCILFHRSRWGLGYRRPISTDVLATSIFSDTYQIWGTVRFALQPFDTQSAVIGFNIAN